MNENAITKARNSFEGLLSTDRFQKSLADIAPKHVTKERIVKMALLAASRQPKLFECTPQSFLQSVMRSAELGLDCVGTLGQGYLVPYYNSKIKAFECQFIAGYQGLIELARRSGHIVRIESRVVYKKDQFNVEYGLDQKLVHKPFLGGDRGEIICVYAIAEMTDGSRQLEVMTLDEVHRIRDRSKAKTSGPWVTDFGEMARKTAIRRIIKYLPKSPDLVKALETDDQQFDHSKVAAEMAGNMQAGVEGLKARLNGNGNGNGEPKAKPVESTTTDTEQHHTVNEGWVCPHCKQRNALHLTECGRCEKKQPEQPEQQQACRYLCLECDHEFDKPSTEGACSKCGSPALMDRHAGPTGAGSTEPSTEQPEQQEEATEAEKDEIPFGVA